MPIDTMDNLGIQVLQDDDLKVSFAKNQIIYYEVMLDVDKKSH